MPKIDVEDRTQNPALYVTAHADGSLAEVMYAKLDPKQFVLSLRRMGDTLLELADALAAGTYDKDLQDALIFKIRGNGKNGS